MLVKRKQRRSGSENIRTRCDTPERDLVIAIIERAINDHFNLLAGKKRLEDKLEVETAPDWLFSDSAEPWSFVWCLTVVMDEPDYWVNYIRENILVNTRGL